jgi:lysophospholipase L1-like esterase
LKLKKQMKSPFNILLLLLSFCMVTSCLDDDNLPENNSDIITDNPSEDPVDDPVDNPSDPDNPIENEPVKYLALGDSYTIGQGVAAEERWPNQLVVELGTEGYAVERLEIIAQTGWRTSNLIDAVEADDPQDFNLVSLLIGVNNQFNSVSFGIFTSEFEILIQKAIQISGGTDRVFVVSIPDYGVTPFGNSWGDPGVIASELDMYNDHMMQRCQELGIPFINITEISRNLGDSEGALAPDNLHPSGFQYSLWVEEILPVVKQILDE